MTPNWPDFMACRGSDPELFFPVRSGDQCLEAQRLCASCPVRDECLTEALKLRDVHGYRGGTTGAERQRILQASPQPDVLAEIRRLKGLRWPKKAICLALGVSEYLVDRAGPATPKEAA
jgi:WhiB family transcriptional regulator, redox-sensing transcriptional regulator